MVKLKLNQLKKVICDVCHGNGFIRVATGDTSIDFRDNSQVHQCWECDSEGEYYEVISSDNLIGDVNGDDTVN
jgi:hypothetical protein|tara:strand:- start:405 stop:623 length:219 start_codon:yes stop_codon:yes gene_type:complete